MSKKYFISGHGNLTWSEFNQFYIPRIDNAILEKARFIVSDFRGCDVMAMEYLKDKTINVTVYHCFTEPRYFPDHIATYVVDWGIVAGFQTDKERDAQMTMDSTDDIAWIRPGKEKSGTAKNLIRRTNILNKLNL